MDCPSCGWKITLRHEWESHGYACAIWRCDSCNCDVMAKTLISTFNCSWEAPAIDDAKEKSILKAIAAILEEARPSGLKSKIEEVLNDD